MNAIISILLLVFSLTACGGGGGGKVVSEASAQTTSSNAVNGGGVIIDTGAWPCDRQLRTWAWKNPYSGPVKVTMVRQWIGFDYTLESDTQAEAWVTAPGDVPLRLLAIQQIDNYKHRSFEQERWVRFSPDYNEIPAGGGVLVKAFCNQISGGANAHITLAIWHL